MPERSLSLNMKSDINEIPAISSALESLMEESGFPGEDILDTQLAVEEVVTNIITHGYESTEGTIAVVCRAGPDAIEIRLEDHAPPFDPLSLPEPDLDADIEDRQIGGLGIFLTRQVMNDVRYHFEDGKNILTLTKKKSG